MCADGHRLNLGGRIPRPLMLAVAFTRRAATVLQIQTAYLNVPPGTARDWCTRILAETQITPLLGDGLGELDGDELGLVLCDGLGLAEWLDVWDGVGLCDGLGLAEPVELCDGLGLCDGLALAEWLALWDTVGLPLAGILTLVSRTARTLAAAAPHRERWEPASAAITGPNVTAITGPNVMVERMKQPTASRAVTRAACGMLTGTASLRCWLDPNRYRAHELHSTHAAEESLRCRGRSSSYRYPKTGPYNPAAIISVTDFREMAVRWTVVAAPSARAGIRVTC